MRAVRLAAAKHGRVTRAVVRVSPLHGFGLFADPEHGAPVGSIQLFRHGVFWYTISSRAFYSQNSSVSLPGGISYLQMHRMDMLVTETDGRIVPCANIANTAAAVGQYVELHRNHPTIPGYSAEQMLSFYGRNNCHLHTFIDADRKMQLSLEPIHDIPPNGEWLHGYERHGFEWWRAAPPRQADYLCEELISGRISMQEVLIFTIDCFRDDYRSLTEAPERRSEWFSSFTERFVVRTGRTSSRASYSYYRQFLKCNEVVCEISVLLESAISSIERWVKSVSNWSRSQNFPTVLTSAWWAQFERAYEHALADGSSLLRLEEFNFGVPNTGRWSDEVPYGMPPLLDMYLAHEV